VHDLNYIGVPSITGTDELVETTAGGRTVRRVGAGIEAGSYASSPGSLTSFTTYGNASAISKISAEKIQKLSAQAKAAKKKA
jgi:hypothetical protein